MNDVLIEPSDSRWYAAAPQADFYARPDVVALEANWTGYAPKAFLDDKTQATIPLLLRPISESEPGDGQDAVSPYGYPGIVAPTVEVAVSAVEAFQHEGKQLGLVSTFLRLHPVLNAGLGERLEGVSGISVVPSGTTVGMGLSASADEWRASLRQKVRYELRQLEKQGYTTRFDAEGDAHIFAHLYRHTMGRIGAQAAYLYDDAYLLGLIAALGTNATVCVVVSPTGEAACAGLFVHTGDLVQYHLSGSDERFRKFSPTRMMIAAARDWATARGARLLHLGGGVGGQEDSLFAFKKDLGDRFFRYTTLRIVHDAQRYAELSSAREKALGAPLRVDFFPAYRQ